MRAAPPGRRAAPPGPTTVLHTVIRSDTDRPGSEAPRIAPASETIGPSPRRPLSRRILHPQSQAWRASPARAVCAAAAVDRPSRQSTGAGEPGVRGRRIRPAAEAGVGQVCTGAGPILHRQGGRVGRWWLSRQLRRRMQFYLSRGEIRPIIYRKAKNLQALNSAVHSASQQ